MQRDGDAKMSNHGWFWRSVWCATVACAGMLVAAAFALSGIFRDAEWYGEHESISGDGVLFLIVALLAFMLAGVLPARVLGVPWWVGCVGSWCAALLSAVFTWCVFLAVDIWPSLLVLDDSGFYLLCLHVWMFSLLVCVLRLSGTNGSGRRVPLMVGVGLLSVWIGEYGVDTIGVWLTAWYVGWTVMVATSHMPLRATVRPST